MLLEKEGKTSVQADIYFFLRAWQLYQRKWQVLSLLKYCVRSSENCRFVSKKNEDVQCLMQSFVHFFSTSASKGIIFQSSGNATMRMEFGNETKFHKYFWHSFYFLVMHVWFCELLKNWFLGILLRFWNILFASPKQITQYTHMVKYFSRPLVHLV